MNSIDDVDEELMWRTAEAVAPEWKWISSCVPLRLLAPGGESVSLADSSWELAEEADFCPLDPYRALGAVMDAAELTGLELPWELELCDGDLRLRLIDRSRAIKRSDALHFTPMLEFEIGMMGDA